GRLPVTARVMGEPTPEGRFGRFGGRFVPETLVPACAELERAFRSAWGDPEFRAELDRLLRDYAGRPSPLTECRRLGDHLGVRLLGTEVRTATSGSRTLKDAINEALRDWVASVESTHYCLGSVMGPHPYPWMVRELHRILGDEAREQCRALLDGRDPDVVTA